MKEESIILNAHPLNKNSVLIVSFDDLKLPHDVDFGSIKVLDSSNRKLLFDLIHKKGCIKKFSYLNDINESHIAVIINSENVKYLKVVYKISNKPSQRQKPDTTVSLENDSHLAVSAGKISALFNKNGYYIEKITADNEEYGPLHLAASGGDLFFQKDVKDAKFDIISDSGILKILKIEGAMKIEGDKCKNQGFLPFEITHYFWSPDGKILMSKAEIVLKFDEAKNLDSSKADFLDPLLWYRMENYTGKLPASAFYTNAMEESSIMTLEHPYYAYFHGRSLFFAMCPYMALPNDGIHVEKGKNFFGACWHSMPEPKEPYWLDKSKKESTGKPQGCFPPHSLRAYWRIGMCLSSSKENIESIASALSYQPKIQSILHMGSEPVSNAFIARWKYNKKMAFNAITDDAKINDYLYRAEGKLPKWAQIAIATRTLYGINYHRFCYVGNKIFCLKKYPKISTLLSTLLCLFGIGKPLRKKFENENFSYLPHTNTHPRIYRLNSAEIINEIEKSEKVWKDKWKCQTPLSHIFSYASPYGLATGNGTMEKAAFSASENLQWIRHWPVPNAPIDFFLPSRLFWGICVGEFFDKGNCRKIREEFIKRYNNGSDYMLISGHVPDYNAECPQYVRDMFSFFEKHSDIWFAGADDIIKYYKCRENMTIGRVKKQGKEFIIEFINNLSPDFFTEITLIHNINKKIRKIQFTLDEKDYHDVEFKPVGRNIFMYNVPSNAKHIRIL
ncbi:hypothetical protein HYT53_02745 [Candidatus Woesearchaeota archaeon]|nr:hypothetical protein [Candidatus Woesearchaeota archaeon]